MTNEKKGNEYVMNFIRGSIYLSMFVVFVLDLVMENKVNVAYISGCAILLYFISD